MATKAIVGIDDSGYYRPAMDLLTRLGLPDLQVNLVYCVESMLPDGSFPPLTPAHPLGEIMASMDKAGQHALDEAAQPLASQNVPAEKTIEHGDPARKLIEIATAQGADLIAAGSTRKSALGSLFFGSVSKALVNNAKQSILIGKTPVASQDGLTAIFATDHSAYADRVADFLIRLQPTGFAKLVIMTADTLDGKTAEVLYHHREEAHGHESQWAAGQLQQQNEALAQRFAPICRQPETAVVPGKPNDAIKHAMAQYNADLLILGAQGHGFMERLTLGSVSMHQAVAEPHNVLILRP